MMNVQKWREIPDKKKLLFLRKGLLFYWVSIFTFGHLYTLQLYCHFDYRLSHPIMYSTKKIYRTLVMGHPVQHTKVLLAVENKAKIVPVSIALVRKTLCHSSHHYLFSSHLITEQASWDSKITLRTTFGQACDLQRQCKTL